MRPELLSRIGPSEAGRYILDDRYWMQPKRDGERLVVERSEATVLGWNKQGEAVAVPSSLKANLLSIPVPQFAIDGEKESSCFCCWDILSANHVDLTDSAYEDRYRVLETFRPYSFLEVVPSWRTAAEKEHMILELLEGGAEGIVFKHRQARYRPGRARQHFKLKFEPTATVRIRSVDVSRNSARIEMLDGDNWREVSGIKITRGRVKPGDYVEVRYRSATSDKHLVEPVFLHKRSDVGDEDCSVDQMEFSGRWAPLRLRSGSS